jgi:hypothetical protein
MTAAKRVVRAVRIAFRAARILATDPQLPWLLRILFVIGCVQIPVCPVDEVAMALALGWLFLFHRDRLAHAVREARSSDPKERKPMNVRKLAVAAAASLAALAAVISLTAGLMPASAAARSPLATVIAHGVRMPQHHETTCTRQLEVMGAAEYETGVHPGSYTIAPVALAGPRAWARQLRRAGLFLLAATAEGVHDAASAHDFTMALLASVKAARMGVDCRSGYPAPSPAACARLSPRPGHVPPAFEIGASGLTWQYVTKREAAYFHVSRCSVVVVSHNRYGQDADFILTPSGRVTGRS